ncbi:MAG: ABC transporter substrate-binding protein [Prevotellaceae bacterium]|jgi:iron complex transport system substrate-binding protein|nr:ABC transporter substrate-binding protein [Prevotellaceae bacterium]
MNYNLRFITVAFIALLFFSCRSAQKDHEAGAEIYYQPSYASGFYMEKRDGEKLLHVFNPWQGAKNMELLYHLRPRAAFHDFLPVNCIPVPVRRAVCLSTSHIAFIDCIRQAATIVGVSGADYITSPSVLERLARGEVREVGYETLLAYETIVALRPDVVFAYGINDEMAAVTGRLNEMGVRVVYLADYLEETVLGKAEYMVAVAAFYDREDTAVARFSEIAERYEATLEKLHDISSRPRVIMNAPWRDTWYMPGEGNYMSRLVHDAGAQVIGLRAGRNSTPVSLEKAYTLAMQAEYWLHPNAFRSLRELQAADPRFARTPAFTAKKIYNNTRRITPGGGSDFWESGVVRPDAVLKDLVHIFHPEILPDHEPEYYERLQGMYRFTELQI